MAGRSRSAAAVSDAIVRHVAKARCCAFKFYDASQLCAASLYTRVIVDKKVGRD